MDLNRTDYATNYHFTENKEKICDKSDSSMNEKETKT